MEATYDMIHLAPREFGNEVMERVAMDYFRENPEVSHVFVIEHGGWHLGYHRDGSIWATANDAAALLRPCLDPPRGGVRRWVRRDAPDLVETPA